LIGFFEAGGTAPGFNRNDQGADALLFRILSSMDDQEGSLPAAGFPHLIFESVFGVASTGTDNAFAPFDAP
jgi:hypothetical protein